MKLAQRLDPRRILSGEAAFVLLTGAALAAWAANASPMTLRTTRLAPVLGMAGLYVLLGTLGARQADRLAGLGRVMALTAYYAAQFLLGFGIVYRLGGGNSSGVLVLPLAAQTVWHLGRWGVLAVNVSICLAYGLVYYLLRPDLACAARSSLVYIAGVAAAIMFAHIAQRERAARAEVERLAGELRAYAARAEELARTKERNRLAREIHDTLGHYLTSTALQVQSAQAMLEQAALGQRVPEVMDALGKAQMLSQEALADVRRSVAALRESPAAGLPLPEAIAALVRSAPGVDGLQAQFELSGDPRPLSPQAELALYRAAQEGLTNAYKHARATEVRVQLGYDPHAVWLSVRDNGVGADAADGGFGLVGLRERMGLVGGALRVGAQPGQGFELRVELSDA
jgi:signal transduction histidine kinase